MAEVRRIYRLTRPYAAVQVEAAKGKGKSIKYIISPSPTDSPLSLAKPDTLLFPLSENDMVVTPDNEVMAPSGKFYRTAKTINPYHLIFDIWDQTALASTNSYLRG